MVGKLPDQGSPLGHSLADASPELLAVLESASRLQRMVPDDQHGGGRGVAAQLARQLADPRPKDSSVTRQLDAYRNLASRWTDWGEVRSVCGQLAADMLETEL